MSYASYYVGQVYRFKGFLVELVGIEGKRATLINSEVPKDGNIKAS